MEHLPSRTILSVLRTVLLLVERNPSIFPNSETLLDFRRVSKKLIIELESTLGAEEEYVGSNGVPLVTALKQ